MKFKSINLIIGCLLTFISLQGVWFRFSYLDSVPYGVYVDEASIGENAYLINKKGVDEWDKATPVFFKAFGEYKNPLYIYTTSWLFNFFEPSIWLLRFSTSIWGISTVLATAWAAYEITKSRWLSCLAGIFLTFLPWHIHASRVVFEAVTFPFFTALIIALVMRFSKSKKIIWLSLTSLVIGLSFYSYTAARLYSPLFVIAFAFLVLIQRSWRHSLLALLISVSVWIPALNFEIENPGSLTARYSTVQNKDRFAFVKTYLRQYDYRLWLTTGDQNLRHTPSRGILPYSLLTPFVIGFAYLLLHLKSQPSKLLMFLFFTAPIAASLTKTDPIALRMIHLIPILIIISIVGIQFLTTSLRHRKVLIIIFALLSFTEFVHFSREYVSSFPEKAYSWFDGAYFEAYPKIRNYPNPLTIHTHVHKITSSYLDRVYGYKDLPPISHQWSNTFRYYPEAWNVYFDDQCAYKVAGISPTPLTKHACILEPNL